MSTAPGDLPGQREVTVARALQAPRDIGLRQSIDRLEFVVNAR